MTIYIVVVQYWENADIAACYLTKPSAQNMATKRNKKYAKLRGIKYVPGYGPYFITEQTLKGAK